MVSQALGCCVINPVYQLLGLNWLTTQCTSSGWREGKNEFSRVTHSVLCVIPVVQKSCMKYLCFVWQPCGKRWLRAHLLCRDQTLNIFDIFWPHVILHFYLSFKPLAKLYLNVHQIASKAEWTICRLLLTSSPNWSFWLGFFHDFHFSLKRTPEIWLV